MSIVRPTKGYTPNTKEKKDVFLVVKINPKASRLAIVAFMKKANNPGMAIILGVFSHCVKRILVLGTSIDLNINLFGKDSTHPCTQ